MSIKQYVVLSNKYKDTDKLTICTWTNTCPHSIIDNEEVHCHHCPVYNKKTKSYDIDRRTKEQTEQFWKKKEIQIKERPKVESKKKEKKKRINST